MRDAHDQVFLDLALAAATPVLVSGDSDLLALQGAVDPWLILSPADFQMWLAGSADQDMGTTLELSAAAAGNLSL